MHISLLLKHGTLILERYDNSSEHWLSTDRRNFFNIQRFLSLYPVLNPEDDFYTSGYPVMKKAEIEYVESTFSTVLNLSKYSYFLSVEYSSWPHIPI